MGAFTLRNGRIVPSTSVIQREKIQNNGISVPTNAYYVMSGSTDAIAGSATGSISFTLDCYGFKLARLEVFHSGAATAFDVSFENKLYNTGSDFDPCAIVANYTNVNGSTNFSDGMDQVESLLGLTAAGGQLYMKLKPYGAGNNWFKYLIFFEEVLVYVRKEDLP